jgi:hypothetical protein
MSRCSRCLREIPDSESICDRCAHEAADPADGQTPLQQVLEEHLPPDAAQTGRPAGQSVRLLAFAMLATVAVGGTATFALLSRSEPAATTPSSTPAAAAPGVPPATVTPDDSALPRGWNRNPEWVGFRKRAVAFELPARNKVPIWLRQAHPYLVVRCAAKRLDVFMYMESAAQIEPQDEKHTVRLIVDDEPEVIGRWQDSDEHDALFVPEPKPFLARLATARVVRIGYRPHNAAPVLAEFEVQGFNEIFTPSDAALCGLD